MKGLKYISWADRSGYAVAARSYLHGLVEAGVDVTWAPMLPGKKRYELRRPFDGDGGGVDALAWRDIAYDTVLVHTVPEYYPEFLDAERRDGRRILGYTVWELDRLPSDWAKVLNRLDAVLVPCRWNVEVFRRGGVTVPIHVVPHLSQFEGMPPASPADRSRLLGRLGIDETKKPFLFYHVGFWTNRKAPFLVIEAYRRAFTAADPVLLVVKTSEQDITRKHRPWRRGFRLHHPKPSETLQRMSRGLENAAPVLLIEGDTLSDAEMRALHEAGDCFVSLARTEGWGFGAYEAARLGKPVVMPGYGGHMDFLSAGAGGAWIVDYSMVEASEPGWPGTYNQGDCWADPDVAQAARFLRSIYEDAGAARARASSLAAAIHEEFDREKVIAALLAALREDEAA